MNAHCGRIAVVALFAAAIGTADARAQNDAACATVLKARQEQDTQQSATKGQAKAEKPDDKKASAAAVDPKNPACFQLAGYIYAALSAAEFAEIAKTEAVRVGDIFSQRDVQNRSTQQADLSGTAAQGHAIPGVQPAGVAAGTIAAVGTDAGQDAIAAISVNPATLFLGEGASEALARLSRLADVTVFVPVSGSTTPADSGGTAQAGKFRYIGARARMNFTGASAGSTVWKKADELLKTRIANAAKNGLGALETILLATSNVKACADALLDEKKADAVTRSCGAPFGFTPDMAAARQLRDELVKVRRAADAKYFGADIRFDFGDPTLGSEQNARGTFLFAGIALGRTFEGSGAARSGFRGRLGLRHAKLDSVEKAEFAAEGGGGYEIVRYVGDDQLDIAAAIEFRYGNAPATATDQFQTNFTMVRGSLLLPIGSGNSLSVNIGAPIAGSVTPMFSVSFNWGLLLSDRPGVR